MALPCTPPLTHFALPSMFIGKRAQHEHTMQIPQRRTLRSGTFPRTPRSRRSESANFWNTCDRLRNSDFGCRPRRSERVCLTRDVCMPRLASDAVVESDEEYTGLTTAALTGRVGAAFALFEVGRCVVRPRPFSIERRRVVAVAARRELPPLYVDAAAPTARTPPPSWSLDNVAGADHSRRRRVGEPIGAVSYTHLTLPTIYSV